MEKHIDSHLSKESSDLLIKPSNERPLKISGELMAATDKRFPLHLNRTKPEPGSLIFLRISWIKLKMFR